MVDKVEVDLERPVPSGIGEVVRPRAVTYSATCQEWFSQGERAKRILPMI
jgi:hypothetical protein